VISLFVVGERRKKKRSSPTLVGDLLDSVLGRAGLKKRIKENEIFLVWEEAVGEAILRNCRPKSITDGILVIETKDNVWMQELSMLRQGIADKINELLGWTAVKELRFKIGPLDKELIKAPKPKDTKKRKPPPEKVDPETEIEIQKALAGIEDEELKSALRSMMIRGVKRKKL